VRYARRPMPPSQLPVDPRAARRDRIARWTGFAFAAVLVVLVAYLGYVGYEGSRQLTDAPAPATDCRTPADMGWMYEAINYDVEGDDVPPPAGAPLSCRAIRTTAGDEVTGPGGVGLAGWYVPAGNGAGPEAPTVVLAHGWGSSKSNLLERAAVLHERFNLVLFDFRNHGQSGLTATTQGLREADDLRAVVSWLEDAKGPDRIAVLGISMGGASALNAATRDPRIDVLVIESTHATLANAIQARLDRAGYPLSLPGAWATLLGTLVRTGEDVSTADPVQSVTRLDGRPILFIAGGGDTSIGPTDAGDLLVAAELGDVPAELQVCTDAGHAQAIAVCPEQYADWVLGFLERHLDAPG
jgi:uncharacterized protein